MSEYMLKQNRRFAFSIIGVFKKDIVFTIALVLALASCFINTPRLEFINFKVLFSLFNLMLVVKAFEELKVLDKIAVSIVNKCSSIRRISLVLTFICFFSSMLITNDVALITFVPLTLIISKKTNTPMLKTIIFQTLAANIGSSLTPMGNPQNLYILSFYRLNAVQFFTTVGGMTLLGGIWLYIMNLRFKKHSIDAELEQIEVGSKTESMVWGAVFCIVTASILGVISYQGAFAITIFICLLLNKSLLARIDYLLLITFVCFFVFIGNISSIEAIYVYMSKQLTSTVSVFISSILCSQLISNVPAAILLSKFTDNWGALLLGVNLGGMGTLIASLASVISYKLFIKENTKAGKEYILKFSLYNFGSLILLSAISYIILVQ